MTAAAAIAAAVAVAARAAASARAAAAADAKATVADWIVGDELASIGQSEPPTLPHTPNPVSGIGHGRPGGCHLSAPLLCSTVRAAHSHALHTQDARATSRRPSTSSRRCSPSSTAGGVSMACSRTAIGVHSPAPDAGADVGAGRSITISSAAMIFRSGSAFRGPGRAGCHRISPCLPLRLLTHPTLSLVPRPATPP